MTTTKEYYSREDFVEEMKVICTDFWGEKKTKKAIKETWEDQLKNLYNDGFDVDLKWKPTEAEIKMLMNR